jgi:hypothetical protein
VKPETQPHESRTWPSRLVLILALLAISAALALLAVWWRLRHLPRYQGKTAGEWFEEYCQIRARRPTMMLLGNRWVLADTRFVLQQQDCWKALTAMGTNAAMYLCQELQREHSWQMTTYRKWYVKFPKSFAHIVPQPSVSRDAALADALEELQPHSPLAVPILLRIIANGSSADRGLYTYTLSKFPYRPEDIESLIVVLAARGESMDALRAIQALGVYTTATTKVLTTCLHGRNSSSARLMALDLLIKLGPRSTPALPSLVEISRDPDDEIRYRTFRVFEAMGTNALPALPAIQVATNDSSRMVRTIANRLVHSLQ